VGNTALPRSVNTNLSPEFDSLTFVGDVAAGSTRIYCTILTVGSGHRSQGPMN
jgi:hypothetical protein